jgi:hypothetical protein
MVKICHRQPTRGCRLRHRSRHPMARDGVGGGDRHTACIRSLGHRETTACARSYRDALPLPPNHRARLTSTAAHSGPGNHHTRGGRRLRRRHPCRSFRLCRRSTPTATWQGGVGVVMVVGLGRLSSHPREQCRRERERVKSIALLSRLPFFHHNH